MFRTSTRRSPGGILLPYDRTSSLAYDTFNSGDAGTDIVVSNGGRDISTTGSGSWNSIASFFYKTSGKWYCEGEILSISVGTVESGMFGVGRWVDNRIDFAGNSFTWAYTIQPKNSGSGNGFRFLNGASTNLGAFTDTTPIISVCFDADVGAVWLGDTASGDSGAFSVSNATIAAGGSPTVSGLKGPLGIVASLARSGQSIRINAGQDAFARTPPSGFKPIYKSL